MLDLPFPHYRCVPWKSSEEMIETYLTGQISFLVGELYSLFLDELNHYCVILPSNYRTICNCTHAELVVPIMVLRIAVSLLPSFAECSPSLHNF